MSIQLNEKLPNVDIAIVGPNGRDACGSDAVFAGQRTVLFAVPGAFTPTCSNAHLPGYVARYDDFIAAGANAIVCLSVNDAFVMEAWAKAHDAVGKITMLADGSAAFTETIGLSLDLTANHMGVRAQRFAMILDDGKVVELQVEPAGKLTVSAADHMLQLLTKLSPYA